MPIRVGLFVSSPPSSGLYTSIPHAVKKQLRVSPSMKIWNNDCLIITRWAILGIFLILCFYFASIQISKPYTLDYGLDMHGRSTGNPELIDNPLINHLLFFLLCIFVLLILLAFKNKRQFIHILVASIFLGITCIHHYSKRVESLDEIKKM